MAKCDVVFNLEKKESQLSMKDFINDECKKYLQSKFENVDFKINYITIYSNYMYGTYVDNIDKKIKVLCIFTAPTSYYIGLKDKFSVKYLHNKIPVNDTIFSIDFYEITNFVRLLQENIELFFSLNAPVSDVILIDSIGYQLKGVRDILMKSQKFMKHLLVTIKDKLEKSLRIVQKYNNIDEININELNYIAKAITFTLIVGDMTLNKKIKFPISDTQLIKSIKTKEINLNELETGIKHLLKSVGNEELLEVKDVLLDNLELKLEEKLVAILQEHFFIDNERSAVLKQ